MRPQSSDFRSGALPCLWKARCVSVASWPRSQCHKVKDGQERHQLLNQPIGLCPFSRSLLPTPIPLPTCLSWHFAFPKEEKHHPPYHSPLTLTLTSTKGQFRLVLRTHNYRQTHSLNNLPDQILGMERVNPGPLVSHSIEGGERCYGKPTPKHPI